MLRRCRLSLCIRRRVHLKRAFTHHWPEKLLPSHSSSNRRRRRRLTNMGLVPTMLPAADKAEVPGHRRRRQTGFIVHLQAATARVVLVLRPLPRRRLHPSICCWTRSMTAVRAWAGGKLCSPVHEDERRFNRLVLMLGMPWPAANM